MTVTPFNLQMGWFLGRARLGWIVTLATCKSQIKYR